MPYTKKIIKSRATSKVRFTLEPEYANGYDTVYLVGDFNNWSETSLPMKKKKDGSLSVELELPNGEKFKFRYLSSEGVWFNDPEAEAYEPCAFSGADNCVLWV
ncbi:MAG: isoamylase early set domain-containing protein [Deltaproteobacteria bacterium]|jgi:1,4-alpha-glucan branching enzyme|nr:isoamylase early set domain-containing protein [Deltaproteobacteria bacterium]